MALKKDVEHYIGVDENSHKAGFPIIWEALSSRSPSASKPFAIPRSLSACPLKSFMLSQSRVLFQERGQVFMIDSEPLACDRHRLAGVRGIRGLRGHLRFRLWRRVGRRPEPDAYLRLARREVVVPRAEWGHSVGGSGTKFHAPAARSARETMECLFTVSCVSTGLMLSFAILQWIVVRG